MQRRYVGDIGDYVKLNILRALSPGRRLCIAWWLFPDEGHNRDGRHATYLDGPGRWRRYDAPLFDALKAIIDGGVRTVQALESLLPPGTLFSREFIAFDAPPPRPRPAER